MPRPFDVTVVGAGIIGLATAMKIARARPDLRCAVMEKETGPARHQTGHNSGVIHSGLYYRPGSLKARTCIEGARELLAFCRERGIPHEVCGKVVVATEAAEIPRLMELYRRGIENGAPGLRVLAPAAVREIEPHVACVAGLHVPSTGIVNYRVVAAAYALEFMGSGGHILYGCGVRSVRPAFGGMVIETTLGEIETRTLVNCAGLYSDHVARMCGLTPPCRIVPFRGEYHTIRPESRHLVRNLVYPVPDPRFPFLGVHYTRMLEGNVEAGPNAVLAFRREGYTRWDISPSELRETLAHPGFWRLSAKYWKPGVDEIVRSFSKKRFTRALQALTPEIRERDLAPGGAGVRAQALAPTGALLDDFVIMRQSGAVHVLNAPSPAATSALAIAGRILAEGEGVFPAPPRA